MSGRVFFDTTILVYALSEDEPRARIAEDLLASGGVLSVQVLNEFTAVARKKLKMSWPDIAESLDAVRTLCEEPAPLTHQTHAEALRLAERFGYHIYDSLILAAALQTKCQILYSEDMQHGQKIGSLTILNPFTV